VNDRSISYWLPVGLKVRARSRPGGNGSVWVRCNLTVLGIAYELPASFIRYTIEWKVKVNDRSISEDTEQSLAFVTLGELKQLIGFRWG
jgi:hypothetical protein